MPKRLPALSLLILAAMLLATAAVAGDAVPDDPTKVHPLLPGMKAPAFTVRRPDGSAFQFTPDTLEKPAVVIFYRGGWCPVCNTYLAEMRHAVPQLIGMGYDVLFLSADQPQALVESLKEKVDYTLLSDNQLQTAKAFGVAFRVTDQVLAQYPQYEQVLETASGETHHQLPVPAVFLIGTDGVIRFMYVNPDYNVRLPPDLLLAAARTALPGS